MSMQTQQPPFLSLQWGCAVLMIVVGTSSAADALSLPDIPFPFKDVEVDTITASVCPSVLPCLTASLSVCLRRHHSSLHPVAIQGRPGSCQHDPSCLSVCLSASLSVCLSVCLFEASSLFPPSRGHSGTYR